MTRFSHPPGVHDPEPQGDLALQFGCWCGAGVGEPCWALGDPTSARDQELQLGTVHQQRLWLRMVAQAAIAKRLYKLPESADLIAALTERVRSAVETGARSHIADYVVRKHEFQSFLDHATANAVQSLILYLQEGA